MKKRNHHRYLEGDNWLTCQRVERDSFQSPGEILVHVVITFVLCTNNTDVILVKATYRCADMLSARSKLCRADQILWGACFIEEAFHYMVHFYFVYLKEILTANYCKPFNIYHVFNTGCASPLAFVSYVLMQCYFWLWVTCSSINGDNLFCLLKHWVVWAGTVCYYKQ